MGPIGSIGPNRVQLFSSTRVVNHNTRLSFSIFSFLSHSILHLSMSIFFYLFANITLRLSFPALTFLSLTILPNLFLSLSQSQYPSNFFNLPFSISFYSTSINVNLSSSLYQSNFTSIFSKTYFSIPYYPSSIILNLFLSLSQSEYTSIFFYLILFYIYQCQSFFISLSI